MSAKVEQAFLRYAAKGEGKSYSTRTGQKIWYNGSVLFFGTTPWKRYLKQHGLVLILGDGTGKPWNVSNKAGISLRAMYSPCLGVLSPVRDDVMPLPEFHAHMKKVIFGQMYEYVYETMLDFDGDKYANEATARRISHEVDRHYNLHASWSAEFKLGWDPLPEMHRNHAREYIEGRARLYLDPDEVRKRQRNAARRQMKKALGLS